MSETKLRLNCILIQDQDVGGYTAFFAEFADVIAEGESQKEAQNNLIKTLKAASEHKLQEMRTHATVDFITMPMDFELEAV